MKTKRLNLYCTCGASWVGDVDISVAETFQDVWDSEHSGIGHEPATAKVAAAARRRNEIREERKRRTGEGK